MTQMTSTVQPSVYLCPECGSEDTYEDPMNDVYFCKSCEFHASIEAVVHPEADSSVYDTG
jgi:ribosomal protein L37AE/L43A